MNIPGMSTFKQFHMIMEMKDSRANRQAIVAAYGLDDGSSVSAALNHASDLIKQWDKLYVHIDPQNDYGFPRNVPGINPRDIFAWARVSKHQGWSKQEALENLQAMMTNLDKVMIQKQQLKQQDKNYDIIYKNKFVTVFHPKSVGASCRLGAGTKWCTAATKGVNHFDSYVKQGVKMYYILPNKGYEREIQKYAIAEYPTGIKEYFDSEDEPYDQHEFEQDVFEPLQIDTSGWLKEFSQVEQIKGAVEHMQSIRSDSRTYEHQVAEETVIDQLGQLRDEDMDEFNEYRRSTGMPDYAFLDASERHKITGSTFKYFMNTRFNHPKNATDVEIKSNKQFQRLLVDQLVDRMDLQIRGNLKGESLQQSLAINKSLHHLSPREMAWELINYSKAWCEANWTDLHEVILQTVLEVHNTFTEGNIGMVNHNLLYLCVEEQPDHRWKELEHAVVKEMQQSAREIVGDDTSLGGPGDNPKMESWTIMMRQAGWIDIARKYNLIVAGMHGVGSSNNIVQYIPNGPTAYSKLYDYPLD